MSDTVNRYFQGRDWWNWMDTAWDIDLSEKRLAADLKSRMKTLSAGGYICLDCGVPVSPAAIESHNIPSPYFAARAEPHDDECTVDGEKNPTVTDTCRPSKKRRNPTGTYPSELILAESHDQIDKQHPSPEHRISSRSTPNNTSTRGNAGRSQRVRTLTYIARTFIELPLDRAEMPLHIPGVDTDRYSTVFKRLNGKAVDQYPELRIFHAELAWASEMHSTAESISIPLYAGTRDPQNPARVIAGHRVTVVWSHWTPRLRALLEHNLKRLRELQRDRLQSPPTKAKPRVFFVGAQNPNDPTEFVLEHHGLIAVFDAILTDPPRTGRPQFAALSKSRRRPIPLSRKPRQ
ncbi:hypothetical protein [Rhodococcus sp. APC 3903]|uniref:hypothetical protein n=1 Tax=Rhodococcus sp. APC 3903 TaxID=3035193 RepID=UPI0025B37543|nr:hypothetical protein [Rhodococcus sp. APC 3903]MDN3461132.1 hypothetical protein [Rhodococcus sp. APC 3903]